MHFLQLGMLSFFLWPKLRKLYIFSMIWYIFFPVCNELTMRWKVLAWAALQLCLYLATSCANLSHWLASPCLALGLPQPYGLLWWSLDSWLNRITLPRFCSFHLSWALQDCAVVSEATALAFPALNMFPLQHFQNWIKIFTYLLYRGRNKGQKHESLSQSHTKPRAKPYKTQHKTPSNPYLTCSTSTVSLNWSQVHLGLFGVRVQLHACCTGACCNMDTAQTLLLLELQEIFYQLWAGQAVSTQPASSNPLE